MVEGDVVIGIMELWGEIVVGVVSLVAVDGMAWLGLSCRSAHLSLLVTVVDSSLLVLLLSAL